MAKEIKCETYRQRCEFLGKDAQVFDMLLSNNGIFVPAPIVKTILVEWEQYKKDGDLHLSEMARVKTRTLPIIERKVTLREQEGEIKSDTLYIFKFRE